MCPMLGDRLMVGRQVLALVIGVQIPVPEHWAYFFIATKHYSR